MPRHILSAGASSPAGWLLCHKLSRVFASCHLLLRSHVTHPSLTPLVCSCQLDIAPLHTTSAYQHATASRLAVLLPSPMSRHCSCCSQFAGIFASVTIVIVALITHRQAGTGVVTLIVVVVIDDIHSHCRCRYIHSRHCNRHCHRRRCHCPPGRCHHC